MKYFSIVIIFFVSSFVSAQSPIQRSVDWKDFLSRHDLLWDQTPKDYFEAPFVGNGLLGAMLYQPTDGLLRLDIGSSAVVERRNTDARSIVDNGRLPVGYFELASNYQVKNLTGRLDLYNAEARMNIITDREHRMDVNLKVLRHKDVIVLEYTPNEKVNCFWSFRPAPSVVPRRLPHKGETYLNPQAIQETKQGVQLSIQNRDAGGCYVTAWKEIVLQNNKRRLLITIQDTHLDNSAVDNAITLINEVATEQHFSEQLSLHKDWWNKYYTASFISIPHPQMESLYWGLQYKLASMMRKGAPFCDLMGPWYKQTVWPGVWFNLNTQMLYSSLHISNQLELTSTLSDYIFENEQNLINSIPEEFRHNSAGLVRCTGRDQIDSVYEWPNSEYPERSNLIYLMYYMWEHYRITMDDVYLEKQFYPLLKRAVNFLLNVVVTDEQGVIHTPKSHSPESTNDVDTNYDLSSLRWGCQTLLAINKRCGINDKQRKEWQQVLKELTPYPVGENGYMSSANVDAPLGHRHWCHLFQIYPYYLVNVEQSESHDVIMKSLKHWGSPKIPNTWTQAVISSMYSSMKDGESALKHLNLALATPNLSSNMTHSEGKSPCSETYGGLSRMLQDILIQSWGGKIRIFPGASNDWKEIVFDSLRAEGGFIVSAERKAGKTDWIQIQSVASEPCIIEHGFKEPFNVKGANFRKINDKTCVLKLKKGDIAILYIDDLRDKKIEPIVVKNGDYNYYGVN